MAAWTTKELREMREMHVGGRPPLAQLASCFPRHSLPSIQTTCYSLGIRKGFTEHVRWLRRAHEYFAERERLWAAYRH